MKNQRKRIKVFLLFFSVLFVFNCDYKREAIGGSDEIVVLSAKEDREKVSLILNQIFQENILTPSPESFYRIIFANPEDFSALKNQTNLIIASLGDYELNPGSKLTKELLGEKKYNQLIEKDQIIISKNQFAMNQVFMIIGSKEINELQNFADKNAEFIKEQFDQNFINKQSQFILQSKRQEIIEGELKEKYNWTINIPWGWEIIKDDAKNNFFWMGQEMPFRWIAVHWVDGQFFSEQEIRNLILELPIKNFKNIQFNQDYIFTEWKNYNEDYGYKIDGLWESIEEAKGGPFSSFVFFDQETNRTFFITYLVFNPGGKKVFYLKQMELIAKTFKSNP